MHYVHAGIKPFIYRIYNYLSTDAMHGMYGIITSDKIGMYGYSISLPIRQ